jgi:hypothetical protein
MIIGFQCSSLLCCCEYIMTNIAHSLETFSKLVTANVAKLILFPFKPLLQPLELTSANFMLQQDGYLYARLHI